MNQSKDDLIEPFAVVNFEGSTYGRIWFLPDDKLNIFDRNIVDGNVEELRKLVIKLNKIWREYYKGKL